MERLWAPWRMRYVGGNRGSDCIFCAALASGWDRDALIVHRGQRAFIILNLFPYNSGHSMVVPYDHQASLDGLDAATRAEMFELCDLVVRASRAVLRCDGFNVGLNIGQIAGAGVADHLHLHVVPRWTGDANFMPIIAGTMVMPELLPVTYARLRAEIERITMGEDARVRLQAGAIVVLPHKRLVALRRAASGDIVIPKGDIEPSETAAQAAIREVREETGIAAAVAGWAGSLSYMPDTAGAPDELRHVSYFLATGEETSETDAHLQTDTLLVDVDRAVDLITVQPLCDMVRSNIDTIRQLAESAD